MALVVVYCDLANVAGPSAVCHPQWTRDASSLEPLFCKEVLDLL